MKIPLTFANYRLFYEPPPIIFLSATKDNLENIDISSKGSIGEIKEFLLLGDEDQIVLDFWLAIQKKTVRQKKTQYHCLGYNFTVIMSLFGS